MGGSSATLPRNREAMRLRAQARARAGKPEVDPAIARIAEALKPEESEGSRAAVLTALGAVFGFAAAWMPLHSMEGWYVYAGLSMAAGALVGALIARLGREGE
jgi:hypothetical protein